MAEYLDVEPYNTSLLESLSVKVVLDRNLPREPQMASPRWRLVRISFVAENSMFTSTTSLLYPGWV